MRDGKVKREPKGKGHEAGQIFVAVRRAHNYWPGAATANEVWLLTLLRRLRRTGLPSHP